MDQSRSIPHPQEQLRLESLYGLQILETPLEQRFEQLTKLVQTVFDVPVCALSCVDLHRQWIKSIHGLNVEQTERCVSFCQHTILEDGVLVVTDARSDDRFGGSPLVTGDPGIVFYAGAPVRAPSGLPIASLCIIGYEPRLLDEHETQILKQFAGLVETMLVSPPASEVEESITNNVGESWRAAMIDPLTRAWNAEGIETVIQESIIQRSRSGDQVAIAMLNLTGLDDVRRLHGNALCDELIRSFSKKARMTLRTHDSMGRLRGGEFGFVLTRVSDHDELLDRLLLLEQVLDQVRSQLGLDPGSIDSRVGCYLIQSNDPISSQALFEQVAGLVSRAESSGKPDPVIASSRGGNRHQSDAA